MCACTLPCVPRISSAPGMGWIYYFCLELGLYMLDESTHWFLCMHVSKACGAPADQDLQDFWMSWKSCIHCQVSLFCTYTKFPDRNEDLCGEIQRDNNLKLEWWTMDLGRVGSPDPPKWDFCLIFVWIIFFFLKWNISLGLLNLFLNIFKCCKMWMLPWKVREIIKKDDFSFPNWN